MSNQNSVHVQTNLFRRIAPLLSICLAAIILTAVFAFAAVAARTMAAAPEEVSIYHSSAEVISYSTEYKPVRDNPMMESIQRGNIGIITEPISNSVFMPVIQNNWQYYRKLGEANQISDPYECSGQTCYDVQVTCTQISRPINATLKVGEPLTPTNPFKGTILFATGWTGTYYWDGTSLVNLQDSPFSYMDTDFPSVAYNNAAIIDHLRADGFRTVQLKWQSNWFQAELGKVEGMGNLACRPATISRWVYDNLHHENNTAPFCATGHSNGASQMAYTIAHYGLADIFSTVVLESGPNWSRIDPACLHDDPVYQSIFAGGGERNTIDWGFGFNNDGTGPCATQDSDYSNAFKEASLIYGDHSYSYPTTMLAFVFGGADDTTTKDQGFLYHDLLSVHMPSLITQTIVPTAPHFVTEIPEGAQVMEDTLRNQCQLH